VGKGIRLSLGRSMAPRGRHLSMKHQTLPRALRGADVESARRIMLLLVVINTYSLIQSRPLPRWKIPCFFALKPASSAKNNDRTACTPLRVLLLGKNNELLASLSFNDCISRESLTHDDCLVKLERSGREELNWPNRAQRHTGLRPGSKRKNAHGHETNTKTYNDLMIEVDIAFGTHFRNYSTAKPSSPQPPQSWSRLSTNYIEAKYVSWISISSALHIAATPAGRTEKVVHVALSSAKASTFCASCE